MSDRPLGDLPGLHYVDVPFRSHAAADATEEYLAIMPFACRLIDAAVYPAAAVTGQDTNTTHLNLINRGTAGTGTTELDAIDLVSGTDLTVGANAFGLATPVNLAAGAVIAFQMEKVGTGLLIPNGTVRLTIDGKHYA